MLNASHTKGLEKKLRELFDDGIIRLHPAYIDTEGFLVLDGERNGGNKYYVYISPALIVNINILMYGVAQQYSGTYLYLTEYKAHPLEFLNTLGLNLSRYTKDGTIELQFKASSYILKNRWELVI